MFVKTTFETERRKGDLNGPMFYLSLYSKRGGKGREGRGGGEKELSSCLIRVCILRVIAAE